MTERRTALVVAVDHYDDPDLGRLAAPAADAAALAEVLGDATLGGFEVDVLHNATSWQVAERVETLLSDRRPADLVLLHFSCHGLKDDAGELFLAATNTVPTRLTSTAVDAALVNRLIRRSRAGRVVLLLDCCYGGAFERGLVARASAEVDVVGQFGTGALGGGRGRAVITASSATEFAFEGDVLADRTEPHPSVFTSALVEGIASGSADRDQDGQVALGELYDYVFDRVRAVTPHQTPSKWEFGLQGDLFVARNPRRRVQPSDLPAELRELVASSLTVVRLGAVAELGHLAAGEDVRLAAAAQLALARLAEDDSRRVCAAALETAARVGALELAAPALDLGRARAGDPALTGQLTLRGAPLVLASPVSTSHPAVSAAIDGDLLRVTAATTAPGPVDAEVTIAAPAGSVVVHVTGSVEPAVAGVDELSGALAPARPPGPAAGPTPSPDRAVAAESGSGTTTPGSGPTTPEQTSLAAAGGATDVLAAVLLLLGSLGLWILLLTTYQPTEVVATLAVPLVLQAGALVQVVRRPAVVWSVGVVAGTVALAYLVLLEVTAVQLAAGHVGVGSDWASLLLLCGMQTVGVVLLVRHRPALRGLARRGLDSWHLAGLVLAGLPVLLYVLDLGAKLADYGESAGPGAVDAAVLTLLVLAVTCLRLSAPQGRAVSAAVATFLGGWLLHAVVLIGPDLAADPQSALTSFMVWVDVPRPSPVLVLPAVLAGCLLAMSRSWSRAHRGDRVTG